MLVRLLRVAFAVVCLNLAAAPAAALTFLTPNPNPVFVGDEVTFTLSEQDVVDLTSYEAPFTYEASLLSFVRGGTNPMFPGADDPDNTFIDFNNIDGTGFITFAILSPDEPVSSAGLTPIFTLTFKTLNTGLASAAVVDGKYFQNFDDNQSVPLNATGQVLIIAPGQGPIPEPATWAMMIVGFGLVGAAIRSGRRRRRKAGGLLAG